MEIIAKVNQKNSNRKKCGRIFFTKISYAIDQGPAYVGGSMSAGVLLPRECYCAGRPGAEGIGCGPGFPLKKSIQNYL